MNAEVAHLRARWDQAEALVRETEAKLGEPLEAERFQLAYTKELLDFADRLDALMTEDAAS